MQILDRQTHTEYTNLVGHWVGFYSSIIFAFIFIVLLISFIIHTIYQYRKYEKRNKSDDTQYITLNLKNDKDLDEFKGVSLFKAVTLLIIGFLLVGSLALYNTSGNEKSEITKLKINNGTGVIKGFYETDKNQKNQSLYAKVEMKNGKNVNIALSEKDVHNGHLYKKAKVKIHSNDNYQLISEKPQTFMGEKDRFNDTKHQIYKLNKHTKLVKK